MKTAAIALFVCLLGPASVSWAETPTDRPPRKGGYTYSLGMPSLYKPYAGFELMGYRPGDNGDLGGFANLGINKDLGNPIVGAAAIVGLRAFGFDDLLQSRANRFRVDPGEIDYINAHGTGTQENDKMEYLSLKAVLGDGVESTPISSNKSMIGHLACAAGAVEAIGAVMTVRDGIIPPTINYETPDPECDLDYVPHTARHAPIDTAMTNSFGFGGHNVALVFARHR